MDGSMVLPTEPTNENSPMTMFKSFIANALDITGFSSNEGEGNHDDNIEGGNSNNRFTLGNEGDGEDLSGFRWI